MANKANNPANVMRRLKTATSIAALALVLGAAPAFAARGGGHGGGGGGGHGGGGAHFGGAHFGGAHFGSAHFSGAHIGHVGGLHFGAMHFGGGHFHASHFTHVRGVRHFAHVHGGSARVSHSLAAHPAAAVVHGAAGAALAHGALAHGTGNADPSHFAAHRNFAENAAFRPFWHHGYGWWRPWRHLGWIGPLFWPYAYGDFFYYALWPYDYGYYDPFWAYGYGDIYEGIFSPYGYEEYVQGPAAPARMATLSRGMAQSCNDEAAEVTGWPIDQIRDALSPDQAQSALLDALGNAVVKASDVIRSHCPTTVSFTPTGRLAAMETRLEGLADAVDIVEAPLEKFYGALNDEQKARFNDIAPPAPQNKPAAKEGGGSAPNLQAQCGGSVMAWPGDRIDRELRPNDAQRQKADALQAALGQAVDLIKASCPTEMPSTPPGRLAAVGKRLGAMLEGVKVVAPVLADFYNSLNDDQKARFNTLGRQLFAQNG